MRYGQVEGEHHKAWVIDQVTRALFGEAYEKYVAAYKKGDAGPNTHEWNESVAP
jgi:hypothetical protein